MHVRGYKYSEVFPTTFSNTLLLEFYLRLPERQEASETNAGNKSVKKKMGGFIVCRLAVTGPRRG